MKISLFKSTVAVCALFVCAQSLRAANQTWTNAAGGDWNTGTNWTSAVPAVGDNASLTTVMGNYTVTYSSPMAAASIAALTISDSATQTATFNVAATGFNLTGGLSIATGGVLNVNTGGNATVGTGISMAGGAFTLNGGTLSSGGDFSMAQSPTIVTPSVVTINSGTLTMTNSGVGRLKFGGYSRSSSFTINGGTVNINSIQTGDTSALNITSGILNVVGSSGGIDLGGASGNLGGALSMTVSGGTITNAMALTVGSLSGRQATLTMSNGTWTQGANDQMYIGKANSQDAGIFNLSGGDFHNIRNLTIGATAYTGTAGTFEGTLNQSGGTWTNDMAVTVGTVGAGKLAISAGNFTAHSASNTATVTVGAAGVLGNLALSGTGNMTVDGLVASSGANSTVSFSGGTLNTKATTIANGSVFTVGNGTAAAALVMNGGTHSFADGLAISNNATLSGNGTVTGNAAVTGNGIINLTAGNSISGTLAVTGGNWNGAGSVTGAVTSSSGTLAIGNGANLTATGGLAVTGSGAISAGNSTSTITGSINYTSSSNSTFAGVIAGSTKTVTLNNSAAVLTLSGTNSYTGATTVTAGTLVLSGGGVIGNGAVAVNGGQFTVNGAVGNGGVTVANGATLGGNGTIAGSVSIASGGTLAPGNSPGIISTGNFSLASGANLSMEINGTSAPVAGSNYDQVHVTTGTVTLGGNLTLTLSGSAPTNGNLYFLINNDGAGAISSSFANVNSGSLSNNTEFTLGGQRWFISYAANYNSGIGSTFTGGNDVALYAVPEPATWALLAFSLTTVMVLRRRRN